MALDAKNFDSIMGRVFNGITLNTTKALFPTIKDIAEDERLLFIGLAGAVSYCFRGNREHIAMSPEALFKQFPLRLASVQEAADIVDGGRDALADFIYDGVGGNVPGTHDGSRYMGRGFLQIRGRTQYTDFAQDRPDLAEAVTADPDVVATNININVATTIWWWNKYIHPHYVSETGSHLVQYEKLRLGTRIVEKSGTKIDYSTASNIHGFAENFFRSINLPEGPETLNFPLWR